MPNGTIYEGSRHGTKTVAEWGAVKAKAKAENRRVHVGRVFGIFVEKGSELKEDGPRLKYKARGVFQGSDVRDEDGYRAVFNDLGAALVSMPARKGS